MTPCRPHTPRSLLRWLRLAKYIALAPYNAWVLARKYGKGPWL